MQMIIDIPDEEYRRWKVEGEMDALIVRDALVKGIKLPKLHGRIIDENEITQVEFETIEEKFETRLQGPITRDYQIITGTDAPAIIEADKGES